MRNMSNKFLTFILILSSILFLGLPSCKTKKGLVGENKEIYSVPFKTFSAKTTFSISLDGVSSFSIGGQLRIKTDSVIVFSIQPLAGVEVARAMVDDSGITLVDRINKRYFSTTFDEMKDNYGLEANFHSIQSIFANVPFAYEKSHNAQSSDFEKMNVTEEKFLLQRTYKGLSQEFVVDSVLQSGTILIESGEIRWNYIDFSGNVASRKFPVKTEIKLKQNNNTQTANQWPSSFMLTVSHRKMESNADMNFSYKIPEGYQRISLEEMIQMYIKNK